MAGLWLPGAVDREHTSPSKPIAGHAQGLESSAAPPQGQAGTRMSYESELAEAVRATQEQPDTGPSPGPSDLEGYKEPTQGHSQTAKGHRPAGVRSVVTTAVLLITWCPTLG